MKKIVVGVVLLLLVLLVAPWGIGKVAEQRINAGIDQVVAQAPYLTVVERKWTGGWFRSEQVVTFEVFGDLLRAMDALNKMGVAKEAPPIEVDIVDDVNGGDESAAMKAASADDAAHAAPADEDAAAEAPEAPEAAPAEPMKPIRFTVRNEILHGPLLWPVGIGIARVNSKLVLEEKVREEIIAIFGTDEPMRVSTRVGLLGGGKTTVSGDGRTLKFKDTKSTISYDDFHFAVGYSSKLDDIDMDGEWPHFELKDADIHSAAAVDGMTFSSQSERVRGDLYKGDFRFAIDKITYTDPEKSLTTIEGIHYIGGSSFHDEFMEMSLKMGSGKVTNKALQAMKLDLSEVHYDFTLRRLHTETLEKMLSAIKAMYTQPLESAATFDTVFMAPLKEHGIALLTHDPEFALDRLGIVTPEGEGVLKGVIRLKGATADDFGDNRLALVMKVEADLTFEAAQKLLEKIPNGATGAGMAVDQGFARREGEKLVSHIIFKRGKLTVNGKDIPLPGLGAGPTEPTVHQE